MGSIRSDTAHNLEELSQFIKGAKLAGTGICSGEGGMLPEEQSQNSHYL